MGITVTIHGDNAGNVAAGNGTIIQVGAAPAPVNNPLPASRYDVRSPVTRRWLFVTLSERFNLESLKTLCFQLGIEADSLPHETREALARELILYCQRTGRLHDLVAAVYEQFPVSQFGAPDGI